MDGSMLVLGNLLLDMVASVEESYLKGYNLIPDSIQTASETHSKIYEELLERNDVILSPGGSALNTVRMAQRILNVPNAITLLGAVGTDETGKLLVETVEKEGVKMQVQLVKNVPTGKCACLLTSGGSARTMVTDLGAALKFSHDRWMESNMELEKVNFLYISGYFLKVSSATAMEIARRVKRRNVPVLLNLNAVWVTTSCKQEIEALLTFVDIIFGNEMEICSFARELDLKSATTNSSSANMTERAACALSTLLLKNKSADGSGPSLVVVTRGEFPVICAENGKSKEYDVPFVSKENLVDSTGAGDAFVGGFLACYVQGKSLDECISGGIWAAGEELKGYGFILPLEIPTYLQNCET